MSSSGSAPPKTRSINVGANLLAEWASDQVRLRAQATKLALGVAACVCVAASIVVALNRMHSGVRSDMHGLAAKLQALREEVRLAEAEKTVLEPKLAIHAMRERTRGYLERFLGEAYGVLAAGSRDMSFNGVRTEVHAAEIVVDARADAKDYSVVESFARRAGALPSKFSGISSTRPSDVLGPEGVAFNYLKRVKVEE